ncbi:MAG: metallophosphoesterase, partial [Candidatus Berkelbacteria bacterium]|nr:metallophosphoesterase [Candidatus Berkelbacteria bacterium]
VQNAYVGVFETTAAGTENGNLFIEDDHGFDGGGTTSDGYYDLADFIAAANVRSIDVYAWITVFGPESTVNVGGEIYKTWVDPESDHHRTYINSLITHLLTITNYGGPNGLKGIVIDYIRYADAGPAEKYRVYQDDGAYTDYTGNFAPANATEIIRDEVASYKETIDVSFPDKELGAEVYSASDDSTYNNWVTADLGQDYAFMGANLDFIIPMAYHIGYHGPQWVSEVVDYVYSKTAGVCGVIPHIQTYQDGKDIEWPGPGELAAATDPIDYAKVSGLAFYSYENTSDNEWVEVKNSFDDNGTKTFANEIIFGSTGTYDLTVKDVAAGRSGTQLGIVIFDGHANGSLVLAPSSPKVYFIHNGMKSWILAPSVFESRFEWNQIVTISQTEMDNYVLDSGEPNLHYREGTLFRRYDRPEVYVVEDGKKRHIKSATAFINLGYNWSNIILAENQDILDAHPDGVDLVDSSSLPNGTLIRTSLAPEVYILENGQRRHIPSPTVFLSQFRWQDIVVVSSEIMNSFPVGSLCPYRSGSIVRSQSTGAIYFIEESFKRHFTSPMFYFGLGYIWEDYVNAESLSLFNYCLNGNDMYQLAKYIDIVGDTQRNPTVHQTVVNLMTNDKPYLVFNSGDLVDTCSSDSGWATFDNINSYLRGNTRYYAALGNHDASCTNFESRFGTDLWQSMDVDNVHFILLDTNESLASGTAQYIWLEADLIAHSSAAFTIVIFHKPPSSGPVGIADAITLFNSHGVELVMNGHQHCYERAITGGITYTINGRGGANPLQDPCHHDIYTQHYESSYGYVRLVLINNQLEFIAYNDSGVLIDSAIIAKIP